MRCPPMNRCVAIIGNRAYIPGRFAKAPSIEALMMGQTGTFASIGLVAASHCSRRGPAAGRLAKRDCPPQSRDLAHGLPGEF
jgi:hypothetical protein